jgi:hypothetical protein
MAGRSSSRHVPPHQWRYPWQANSWSARWTMVALPAPPPWTRLFCGSPMRSSACGCCAACSHPGHAVGCDHQNATTLPRRPPSWYPSGESTIWMRRSIWQNSALLVAYTSFTHQTCTKERSTFQKTATSETIRHAGKRLSRTQQLCRARQAPQRTPTGSDTKPVTRNSDMGLLMHQMSCQVPPPSR